MKHNVLVKCNEVYIRCPIWRNPGVPRDYWDAGAELPKLTSNTSNTIVGCTYIIACFMPGRRNAKKSQVNYIIWRKECSQLLINEISDDLMQLNNQTMSAT